MTVRRRSLPVAIVALAALARAQDAPVDPFAATVRPLLDRYCLACHSTAKQKGDIDLEAWTTRARASEDPVLLQDVADQLTDRAMPPDDADRQPTDAERDALVGWVRTTLTALAAADAGDPGPVVLRRLSNAEYGYTVRDLTGVASLDPAREFPVDGAAGEGFTNVGQALVMSPALLEKYLDAAKRIADHAVLLPTGIRFSPATSRRDWTEERLAALRAFYRHYTEPTGGDVVNLQGIVFATNSGGRIPLGPYLLATLELRDGAHSTAHVEDVARRRGLAPRYLRTLFAALTDTTPSAWLDPIRTAWRDATPASLTPVVAAIAAGQERMWRFNTVGHIGKAGGPPSWLEPIEPWADHRDFAVALGPTTDGVVHIVLDAAPADATDAGATVVFAAPRFVAPGRPDLLLRDVPTELAARNARRDGALAATERALAAVADLLDDPDGALDVVAAAARHAVDVTTLRAWLECAGVRDRTPIRAATCFRGTVPAPPNAPFVTGFGVPELPALVANPTGDAVRIPGNLAAHGIAVHPSPSQTIGVGWRSPLDGTIDVAAAVRHAHDACGNGVTWTLDVRRAHVARTLDQGAVPRGGASAPITHAGLAVRSGDFVVLAIGAGGGDHSCDLTAIDLTIRAGAQHWDLAAECAPDLLAGNPHADAAGNGAVWHFFGEPDADALPLAPPTGSALSRWLASAEPAHRTRAAAALAALVTPAVEPAGLAAPDTELRQRLRTLDGPLARGEGTATSATSPDVELIAPARRAFEVPAALVAGATFVTTARVSRADGIAVVDARATLEPTAAAPALVVGTDPAAHTRAAAMAAAFRDVFPAALCYATIVPVDEVITLTQFHREDEPLRRLVLEPDAIATLDRLWDELHFVSRDALTQEDAFEQLWQYATQDADPSAFEPLRAPIAARAADFRQRTVALEPLHVAAVTDFAARAWRRPLADAERAELAALYDRLRAEEIDHDAAIRLLLARVLMAPAFLYRIETPPPGADAQPVDAYALATRLAYFLWSSTPDAALTAHAADGSLLQADVLVAETRRMLQHPNVRRLAIEFGCAWLHVRGFDEHGEKSEAAFPTFAALRGSMYEETIRFLTDLVQNDGTLLDVLDADHTFVDATLAAHYGLSVPGDAAWHRVDGLHALGRTGVLTQASVLAAQSGASRTSPILRGNWVSEVLLGERLPRPPKDVPRLPEDEANATLSVRELTERHSSDPRCARCHDRVDAFGFALEAFDGIGRFRTQDIGGRPIDTQVTKDGRTFDGALGLRDYLFAVRRDAFVRQFCKKLLGYALGRAVRLSDESLLATMQQQLAADGYRIAPLFETIVTSPQFTRIRGRDTGDKR